MGTHRNKRQFDFIIFFSVQQVCDPLNNMRTLFYNYCLLLCINQPIVKRRIWAEEFRCTDWRADSRGGLLLLLLHSHRSSNIGDETQPHDAWLIYDVTDGEYSTGTDFIQYKTYNTRLELLFYYFSQLESYINFFIIYVYILLQWL